MIVRVALDIPLPRLFDYRADSVQLDDVGRRVRVPFGRDTKVGVIAEITESSDRPFETLKEVVEILRDMQALPNDWIELCRFCSRYYHQPLGAVMAMALPPMLRKGGLPKRQHSDAARNMGKDKECSERPELLPEQRVAVNAIVAANGFTPFLLYGVTGSGKTEVYLNAIEQTLAAGRQALMLVPEIALTPQLEKRVYDRFPAAGIVSAHSGMPPVARANGFLAAMQGRVDIVLGTRLSVFTPLPRLGLVIVDEEHDTSFKQQEGIRYSARDVAVFRAKMQDTPIVLGSATPSLETYQNALNGRYRMLRLSVRAVATSMPLVKAVDTSKERLVDGISQALASAIEQRLARGEQSLLFLNRRGYAPVLACAACGWISNCRRCAAHMVLHLTDRRLRCHHCGVEALIPKRCPDCGNLDIHPFGRGTQRLESALAQRYPGARILRVDRDSANSPKKWQQILATIHQGEADILIGTQMLAKGHDFPRLTLVGVIGADAALFASDFRAPERLFAQLLQVGGRSGRASLPGEVLIQTEHAGHPMFQALADSDFDGFAKLQLSEREAAGFPPSSYQALLSAEAATMADALEFLAVASRAAPAVAGVRTYDPVPMRLQRKMNLDRAQLLVESESRTLIQEFLAGWLERLYEIKAPRSLRWHIEVDPVDL